MFYSYILFVCISCLGVFNRCISHYRIDSSLICSMFSHLIEYIAYSFYLILILIDFFFSPAHTGINCYSKSWSKKIRTRSFLIFSEIYLNLFLN